MSGNSSHIAEAIRRVSNDLIDDAILSVIFEVHRAHKIGLLDAEGGAVSNENEYRQVNEVGLDIFGQTPIKKSHECICPNCKRNLAASRFAPHLEKCMGMGRNSSRIASRRIQNTTRENASTSIGMGGASDDEADDDWLVDRKKRKRDKNSPRRSRKVNPKTSDGVSWSVIASSSDSEKRAMLSNMCGVVSEHTRKMCTRSMKCPQHTNNQRRAVREQLLGSGPTINEENVSSTTVGSSILQDQNLADVLEENSNGAVSSSWDHDLNIENSNSTSPADSTSTTLSSLSSHSSLNNGTSLPASSSQGSNYSSYYSDANSASKSLSHKSKSERASKSKKKSSKSSHSSDK